MRGAIYAVASALVLFGAWVLQATGSGVWVALMGPAGLLAGEALNEWRS